VSARLGEIDYLDEKLEQGIGRMEKAFSLLADEEPDADLATLATQLGRLHLFSGAHELAASRLEFALALAEKLGLPEQLSQGLNSKGVLFHFHDRIEEGTVLLAHALKVALDHDLASAALRAYNNLAGFLEGADRYAEARHMISEGLDLARRAGDRSWEGVLFTMRIAPMVETGEWDEAVELVAEARGWEHFSTTWMSRLLPAAHIHVQRGSVALARELLEACSAMEHSEEIQSRTWFSGAKANLLRGEGRYAEALPFAVAAAQARSELGVRSRGVKIGFAEELEAAYAIDPAKAEEPLSRLEQLCPGETTPLLSAQAARFRAKLDATAGERGFASAIAIFRECSSHFWLAVTLLEQAELLVSLDRETDAEPMLVEAREIFERLRARPWLDRVATLTTAQTISA
jgi:tetratricopeptide (TPR) repeat protein